MSGDIYDRYAIVCARMNGYAVNIEELRTERDHLRGLLAEAVDQLETLSPRGTLHDGLKARDLANCIRAALNGGGGQ